MGLRGEKKKMIQVKKQAYLILLLQLIFLTSCWDIDEADRMNYVHGVGIDYVEGEILIYLQIANMGSLGSPDLDSESERHVVIAKEKGHNISSIIHKIYQSAQRKLYFGHNTFIVLSESALQNGLLNQSLDLMNRFPQTRYRVNIFATHSSIEDLLNVTTLFEETAVLTRITDLENTYELSSLVKNISMRELIIQLDEPGYDGIIPAISLNENTWQDKDQAIAAIETIGVALVQPDKFCGFIIGEHIHGLRWLQNSERNAITVFNNGKPISEIVTVNPKYKISVLNEEENPTFEVNIRVKGMIIEVIEAISQEDIIKKLKETIEMEIRKTFLAGLELESDIYRLSEHLYRYNFSKWKEVEVNGAIPLHEESLSIHVEIDLMDTSVDKLKPTIR